VGLIEKWKEKKKWEKIKADRAAEEKANEQLMIEAEAEAPRYLNHRIVKMAGDRAIFLCKLYCLGEVKDGRLRVIIDKDLYEMSIIDNVYRNRICITADKDGFSYGYDVLDNEYGETWGHYIRGIDNLFHRKKDMYGGWGASVKEGLNISFAMNGMGPADETTQKALLFAIRDYCKQHYLDSLNGYTFETEVKDHLMITIGKKEGTAPKLEAWK